MKRRGGAAAIASSEDESVGEAIVEPLDVDEDHPLGRTTVKALKGINLVIERGEFTTIAGPSGSGKTTLLNLVGGVWTSPRVASCAWLVRTPSR